MIEEQDFYFGEDFLLRRQDYHVDVAGGFAAAHYYHLERNHQGLRNRLIVPIDAVTDKTGPVRKRQRLGGMLNYYYRDAA